MTVNQPAGSKVTIVGDLVEEVIENFSKTTLLQLLRVLRSLCTHFSDFPIDGNGNSESGNASNSSDISSNESKMNIILTFIHELNSAQLLVDEVVKRLKHHGIETNSILSKLKGKYKQIIGEEDRSGSSSSSGDHSRSATKLSEELLVTVELKDTPKELEDGSGLTDEERIVVLSYLDMFEIAVKDFSQALRAFSKTYRESKRHDNSDLITLDLQSLREVQNLMDGNIQARLIIHLVIVLIIIFYYY